MASRTRVSGQHVTKRMRLARRQRCAPRCVLRMEAQEHYRRKATVLIGDLLLNYEDLQRRQVIITHRVKTLQPGRLQWDNWKNYCRCHEDNERRGLAKAWCRISSSGGVHETTIGQEDKGTEKTDGQVKTQSPNCARWYLVWWIGWVDEQSLYDMLLCFVLECMFLCVSPWTWGLFGGVFLFYFTHPM